MTPVQFKKRFIFSVILYIVFKLLSWFWTFKWSEWNLASFDIFNTVSNFIFTFCYFSLICSVVYYPLRNLKTEEGQNIPKFVLEIKKYIWALLLVLLWTGAVVYQAKTLLILMLSQVPLFWTSSFIAYTILRIASGLYLVYMFMYLVQIQDKSIEELQKPPKFFPFSLWSKKE